MVIPKSSGIMFELATVINNPKNKMKQKLKTKGYTKKNNIIELNKFRN